MSDDESTVMVEFTQDTKTENKVVTVATPYDDRGAAADKVMSLLKGADPFLKMRDVESGEYRFVHTMKTVDIKVYFGETEQ